MLGKVGWNMGTDKQMNNYNLEKVKETFLNDALLTKKTKPEIYSLPDEFAKSKRNKSLLVYAMVLLYAFIIGAGVYLLTFMEEQKSKRVEVNIAEFKQFNLMELLEQKKENEQKLVQLQKELEKVKADSLAQIRKLTPEEQRKAMAELNEKLQKLEVEYKAEVKSNKKALKNLEKTVASEKKRNEKSTRETEKMVEDYQKLNQKKADDIQKITESYEAKITKLRTEFEKDLERLIERYNPTFSKGEIATVLDSNFDVTIRGSWNSYVKKLQSEGIVSNQEIDNLRQKIKNQTIIIENLQEIDFINSIPLALKRLEQLSSSIINDYEALCGRLVDLTIQKKSKADNFEYAMSYLTQSSNVAGFVLDARGSSQLIIYLNRDYSVTKGETAQIYKNGNDLSPIAEIELYPENDKVTAKVKKRFGSAKIEPFDKVILNGQGLSQK